MVEIPMEDGLVNLIKLAQTGDYMPMAFLIAMRHHPGYKIEDAPHIENQWFDGKGFPMPNAPEGEE